MGLTYRFKLRAPGNTTAEDLEEFLKTVEVEAKRLDFEPTLVLRATFDNADRREFSRRLTHGLRIQREEFKGVELKDGQVWDHQADTVECRLIPREAVVPLLLATVIPKPYINSPNFTQ